MPIDAPVLPYWMTEPLSSEPHCTPRLIPSPSAISTISASINTCARRISSCPITSSIAFIMSCGAVSTNELVSACAAIITSLRFEVVGCPVPFSACRFSDTPFSTSTRSSALAYFKYTTRLLPLAAISTSNCLIRRLRRSRTFGSPEIKIELVRSSATNLGFKNSGVFCASVVLLSASTIRTISAADALLSSTTSISLSPAWSTRRIISAKRFTTAARPVIKMMFAGS